MQLTGLLAGLLLAGVARGETIVKPLVEVGSEARYDSDPYLDNNGEFFSKITPKFGGTLGNERLKLDGWYAADLMYKAVQQTPELDHRAHLGLKWQASERTNVRADVGLWRVQDPTSLPRLGVAAVKSNIFYSTTSAGISYRLSRRLTLHVDDKQEAAKIQDAKYALTLTQTPSAGLSYALSQRTDAQLAYRYQVFLSLPHIIEHGVTTDRTTAGQTHTLFGQVVHRFTPTWTGRINAGPQVYSDRFGKSTLVPAGEAALDWASQHADFDLIAGHDVVGSVGYANAVWADYASANYAVHPSRPWRFNIGAAVFRNGLAPMEPETVQGYSFGGGAGYAITDEINVDVNVVRIVQQAKDQQAAVALDRNIGAVRLTWTPAFNPKEF